MELFNTATGRKEAFSPKNPECVTMYVCGPTVYSYAHIGNARPAVVFDVLARLLRRRYPRLVYVRNITDIDDKINAAASAEGTRIDVIADRYAAAYHEDLAALGVIPPDFEPRVTAYIPQILEMIKRLIRDGHAYVAEDHVVFDVSTYADYGALSHRNKTEMLAGARVEVAPYKRDPADFVLWKPSTDNQPGWESPWGLGRPGWHIECSAMAETLLGETIDIHGGGHDLIFPHHENEQAQSVCAHGGTAFVRFWVHNGFLTVDRNKMSKSVGNTLLLRNLLSSTNGEVVRMALLTAHYRQPLDWNDQLIEDAKKKLNRLYGALQDAKGLADVDARAPDEFMAALEDDLNTPAALAVLFEHARLLNKAGSVTDRNRLAGQLSDAARLLGLLASQPENWFGRQVLGIKHEDIERLVQERAEAKQARDYAAADRIRERLRGYGVAVEDSPDGVRWRVIN